MPNASHITVGSTTYDIVSANGPFSGVTQWNPPISTTASSWSVRIWRHSQTVAFFQFLVGSTYYSYKTADFKTWTSVSMPVSGEIRYMNMSPNGTYWIIAFNSDYTTNFYISRNAGSSFTKVAHSSNYISNPIASDDGQFIFAYASSSSGTYTLKGINASNAIVSFSGTQYGKPLVDGKIFKINNYYCFNASRGPDADTATIYISNSTTLFPASPSLHTYDTTFILMGIANSKGYVGRVSYSLEGAQFTPTSSSASVSTIFSDSFSGLSNSESFVLTPSGRAIFGRNNGDSGQFYSYFYLYDFSDLRLSTGGSGPHTYAWSKVDLFYLNGKVFGYTTAYSHPTIWTIDQNSGMVITGVI